MCYQTKEVSYQTPWIYYNWLLSNLLIEKNNEQRKKSINKAMECLDQYYKQVPTDGFCNGGAEIWQYATGKYFQSLELLEMASVGEINIYGDELLKNMGEFICATHIDDNYYFNYSECSPKLTLPASLIFCYGEKVKSDMMVAFGSYIAKEIKEKNAPLTRDLFNKLKLVIDYDEMLAYTAKEPLLSDSYMKESQVVVTRSQQGSNDGFYFGVKGGSNDVSACQNDAGNFILYTNGRPLIIDPGEGAKMGNPIKNDDRDANWTDESAWHNLPTINGRMENSGANHRVTGFQYSSDGNIVTVSMNLAYAYKLSSGVDDWIRTFTFNRNKGLEISDHYNLSKIEGETYISFIALSKPEIKRQGVVLFHVDGKEYEFNYRSDIFTIEINEVNTESDPFLKVWGLILYKIVLKPNSIERSGIWDYSFKKV